MPESATTVACPLSLHDALPIFMFMSVGYGTRGHAPHEERAIAIASDLLRTFGYRLSDLGPTSLNKLQTSRSEEHTSELQSRLHLVCRLLLEKKKTRMQNSATLT